MSSESGTLESVVLAQGGNEASDLMPVANSALLATHGWDLAFWTCLDEGPAEDNQAIIGHRVEDGVWEIHHLPCVPSEGEKGRTDDSEALARHEGYVYVVGSHYGKKAGPLHPSRAWFARFNETSIDREVAESEIVLQVVRDQFRLHRIVNDALDSHDVIPITPGDNVRTRFIAAAIQRGEEKSKKWVRRLTDRDVPMNIEAAAFRPNGNLLIGLRFPTTAYGQPILVELSGVPAMFDSPGTWPAVERIFWLGNAVPEGALVGFRALTQREGDTYDAIVGSLDALGKGSVLVEDHPEGGDIHCYHWSFTLPDDGSDGEVTAELQREFPDRRDVEGISVLDGYTYYVFDEPDRIELSWAY